VILVLPKCLLTWGYVEVEAAAFCLQHDRRHGESAGPVEIDLPEHLPQEWARRNVLSTCRPPLTAFPQVTAWIHATRRR